MKILLKEYYQSMYGKLYGVDEALPSPSLKLSKSQIKGMIKRAKNAGARGYDIILSLSRDLSITSDEVVSTLEKHRLIGMTEGHISKHHPARAFDPIDEGPADDDMKEAEKLKKPLINAIAGIGRSMDNINRMMSSFNAPGLKHAFIDAIKIGVKRQGKFDELAAYKRFKDYYDR